MITAKVVEDTLLTADEVKILRLLVEGKGVKEIAWELNVTKGAICSYRMRQLKDKLGIKDRTMLIVWAVKHGFAD